MKYVGLTDDPIRRRREHGIPADWRQRRFRSEDEARRWEQDHLHLPGHTGGGGAGGWRYGYTYTVTRSTVQ